MLERADITADKTLRARLLNFVVVGGGLSGIETAAELNSFLRKAIKYYPNIDSDSSSTPTVTIVQSRDRILPEFALTLAEHTLRSLVHDGISVILNSKVVAVENGIATVSDRGGKETAIETATVIWTAGIAPIAVTSCIPGERSSSGRLQVDGHMRVRSQQDIWAIGDCALLTSETSGDPLPATAQYAIREAELVASNIAGIVKGSRLKLKQFRYDRDAQMAVIGDKTAIARMAGRNVSGFWVWCLWRIVYLNKLPMLKKRLRVLFDWTVDIFFDPDLTHLRGLEERKNQKSNRDIRHAESS
jgi:NADH dehydrogenase